jgi:4-hydroxybenzoate polyprenyltransferase
VNRPVGQPAALTWLGLWRLARPRGMALVLSMPALGYGFGHWEWALPLQQPDKFGWLLAGWWFLSAGTLWLNAAFDQDDGDVLMGAPGDRQPAPSSLWGWGLGALCVAVALSALASPVSMLLCALCAGLAVGYSHPRLAWKAHPLLGPLVNIAGYGVLSPLAGFLLVEGEPTVRTTLSAALVASWVGGTYFGAQGFQHDEDARRGYRTLVVTHGPRVTILTARALYGASIGGFVALAAWGMYPRVGILVLLPWLWLDRHMADWAAGRSEGFVAARGMLQRATWLGVSLMVLVTTHHLWQLVHRGLPAGLGTAWRP